MVRSRASGEVPATCRQHHRIEPDQFGGRLGLAFIDVQAGTGDPAVAQRGGQRGRVDHAAARDIDEETARAERRQHRRVDQVPRVGAAGQCRGHAAADPAGGTAIELIEVDSEPTLDEVEVDSEATLLLVCARPVDNEPMLLVAEDKPLDSEVT
ncbi:hypothetical protein BCC0238_006259 [Burkholderia gladioli]